MTVWTRITPRALQPSALLLLLLLLLVSARLPRPPQLPRPTTSTTSPNVAQLTTTSAEFTR